MMPAVEAYPLPARPLPASARRSAPIVDLRGTRGRHAGLDGLSPWRWCVEYVRRFVAGSTQRGIDELVEDPIKGFDSTLGQRPSRSSPASSKPSTTAAPWPSTGGGRPPSWPAVSDILGVDAMDVPPPDRKGAGLADGHAVVALGYGRHAAFPGGGYLIVRNPWSGRRLGASRRRLPAVHVPAGLRHGAAHVPAHAAEASARRAADDAGAGRQPTASRAHPRRSADRS